MSPILKFMGTVVVAAVVTSSLPIAAMARTPGHSLGKTDKCLVLASGEKIPTWLLAGRGRGKSGSTQEWDSLSPEEKAQMRRRMQQLKQMPAQDRRQFERIFNKWQQLSPQEQGQVQRSLESWDSLPESQKQSIRRKFQN